MRGSRLLGLIALLGLTACSCGPGSSTTSTSSNPTPPVGQGYSGRASAAHPIYGVLTASQLVLLGPDQDANGVRDDVDGFIAQKYSVTPLAQKAVTAYAKDVTGSMLYADKLITEEESSRRLAVFYCAADELIRAGVPVTTAWNKNIIARTADTEERLRAYDKWDRAQNVSTSINLESDPCAQVGL